MNNASFIILYIFCYKSGEQWKAKYLKCFWNSTSAMAVGACPLKLKFQLILRWMAFCCAFVPCHFWPIHLFSPSVPRCSSGNSEINSSCLFKRRLTKLCLDPVQVSTDIFNYDKDSIIQKLRDIATRDTCCGQHEVTEKKVILNPKSEATVYAIVTNVIHYNRSGAESNGGGTKNRSGCLNGIGTSWKRSRSGKRKPRR